jgi:hypothetical protein
MMTDTVSPIFPNDSMVLDYDENLPNQSQGKICGADKLIPNNYSDVFYSPIKNDISASLMSTIYTYSNASNSLFKIDNISDNLIKYSSIPSMYNDSYKYSDHGPCPAVWYMEINSTFSIIHAKPTLSDTMGGVTDAGDEIHAKSVASAVVGYHAFHHGHLRAVDDADIVNVDLQPSDADAFGVGERVDGCEKSLNEVEEARISTPFALADADEKGGIQIQPAIGQSGAGVMPRKRPRQGTHVRGKLDMAETQNAIGDWEIWKNMMESAWEKRATDKPAFKEKYEQHAKAGKDALESKGSKLYTLLLVIQLCEDDKQLVGKHSTNFNVGFFGWEKFTVVDTTFHENLMYYMFREEKTLQRAFQEMGLVPSKDEKTSWLDGWKGNAEFKYQGRKTYRVGMGGRV